MSNISGRVENTLSNCDSSGTSDFGPMYRFSITAPHTVIVIGGDGVAYDRSVSGLAHGVRLRMICSRGLEIQLIRMSSAGFCSSSVLSYSY
jgi:hypothetical protein